MKKTVACVYGYGLPSSSGRVGEQTRGRLDKAIDLYRKGVVSEIWISVGGEPVRDTGIYKHESMRQYLESQGVEHVVALPIGTTTLEETHAFRYLQNESKKGDSEGVDLWVVSSKYHISRIKTTWFMCYNEVVNEAHNIVNMRLTDRVEELGKHIATYCILTWRKTTLYVRNWKLA